MSKRTKHTEKAGSTHAARRQEAADAADEQCEEDPALQQQVADMLTSLRANMENMNLEEERECHVQLYKLTKQMKGATYVRLHAVAKASLREAGLLDKDGELRARAVSELEELYPGADRAAMQLHIWRPEQLERAVRRDTRMQILYTSANAYAMKNAILLARPKEIVCPGMEPPATDDEDADDDAAGVGEELEKTIVPMLVKEMQHVYDALCTIHQLMLCARKVFETVATTEEARMIIFAAHFLTSKTCPGLVPYLSGRDTKPYLEKWGRSVIDVPQYAGHATAVVPTEANGATYAWMYQTACSTLLAVTRIRAVLDVITGAVGAEAPLAMQLAQQFKDLTVAYRRRDGTFIMLEPVRMLREVVDDTSTMIMHEQRRRDAEKKPGSIDALITECCERQFQLVAKGYGVAMASASTPPVSTPSGSASATPLVSMPSQDAAVDMGATPALPTDDAMTD